VFTAEAEATAEHRAYNVAHSDPNAMIDKISMQVGTIINNLLYLLTAIGLSPGGSTHLQTNNT